MSTIFTSIIEGKIKAHRIAESDEFYAFLDIKPVQIGHTLIVPKREVDYYFDLSSEELGRMQGFCQQVAAAIRAYTACRKVGLAVVGLEVNHAHVHLIPLNEVGDMDMSKTIEQTAEELRQTAEAIRAYIPEEIK